MRRNTTYSTLNAAWQQSCRLCRVMYIGFLALLLTLTTSCEREPELHLFDVEDVEVDLPLLELELETLWEVYGEYDWRNEWYYGWYDDGQTNWGYTEPTLFDLLRYYTGNQENGPYTTVKHHYGEPKVKEYKWTIGYWDILAWNHIMADPQSLIIDDITNPSEVTATTNMSMNPARYNAPRFTRAFNEPEELFTAYQTGILIDRNHEGPDWKWDEERNRWVKRLKINLRPVTYIYLIQVILHNNGEGDDKKIKKVAEDTGILSGMANSTVLNTTTAGPDAACVYYDLAMKKDCRIPKMDENGNIIEGEYENVDIVGGRLLTFGICNLNAHQEGLNFEYVKEFDKANEHKLEVKLMFKNDTEDAFTFDVSDQVRNHWLGGVITVHLYMDKIPIPQRSGGSAFDAVVKDFEEVEIPVIEM